MSLADDTNFVHQINTKKKQLISYFPCIQSQFRFNKFLFTKKGKSFFFGCVKRWKHFFYIFQSLILTYNSVNLTYSTRSGLYSCWMGFVKWLCCDFDYRMDSKNAEKEERKLKKFYSIDALNDIEQLSSDKSVQST